MSQELVTVTIDGKTVQVPKGTLLVEVAKKAGINIPVFCYHPKLDPAGVCRMCLVSVEKMPKLTTACTLPVADGMVVNTQTPEALEARKGVLEFLLLNHPLDCPVCDKGGECDLQDLTYAHGPGVSRLQLPKEHKLKAADLGPFIVLDQERCILCRRCVRFDDEVAQERQLVIKERAHDAVVTTAEGEAYDNYFTGNTIELCPVGALTSRQYRFKARPWDLVKQASICTGCSVGCNIRLDSRMGQLLRVVSRDNPEIDNGWLCDRGRFNYHYTQSATRVQQPLLRKNGELVPVSWSEALQETARQLKKILAEHGGEVIGAIGGGRLTNEEAYLFQKLARVALQTPHIDHRTGAQAVASLGAFPGKIADVDDASVILEIDVLLPERAPVLDLRVRRAAARKKSHLIALGAALPEYKFPHRAIPVRPGMTAPVVAALAARVEHGANAGAGPQPGNDDPRLASELEAVVQTLAEAAKVVVLWSGDDAATGSEIVRLLSALKAQGKRVHALIPGEQANTRGAEAMGVLPGFLPGYQPVSDKAARQRFEKAWRAALPEGAGMDAGAMWQAALDGRLQALYLASANPVLTYPDGALVRRALERVPFLIVQDLFLTETARYASVVFPAAPFTAKEGHFTALDGRVQRVSANQPPGFDSRPDDVIFQAVAEALGVRLAASSQELAWEIQHLVGPLQEGAFLPGAPATALEAAAGATSAAPGTPAAPLGSPAVTATPAEAESLVLVAVDRLYAGGGTARFDPEFSKALSRPAAVLHPADAARLGVAQGDEVALSGPNGRLTFPVRLSHAAAPGTVLVPRGVVEAPANLLQSGTRYPAVRVEALRRVLEEVV